MSMTGSGCSAAEPYALRVIGDSMAPEFKDGQIIIVDPGMPLVTGAYVVIDYDGDTTFRQFVIEGQQKFLKALNENHETVEIVSEYTVRGVVLHRAGRSIKETKHYY